MHISASKPNFHCFAYKVTHIHASSFYSAFFPQLSGSTKLTFRMADNEDLLDYEEEDQTEQVVAETTEQPKKDVKGTYVSIHSSGFRDFLLKPEILRAIVDCGFEHPSEGELSSDVWAFFFPFFLFFHMMRLSQYFSR